MKFKVRKALLSDVDAIANIHVSSWINTYSGLMPQTYIESYTVEKRKKLWSNIIEKSLAEVIVADVDDRLTGFLCCGQPKSLKGTDVFDLSSIYIEPDKTGSGIGQALYDECEGVLITLGAKKVSVWALDDNERAINFYIKQGFVPTGKTNDEYVGDVVLKDIELAKELSL